jgi:hypothetical protein
LPQRKCNLLCRVLLFSAHRKPALSGDAKVKKPNIPDGSRNGEDVKLPRDRRSHAAGDHDRR